MRLGDDFSLNRPQGWFSQAVGCFFCVCLCVGPFSIICWLLSKVKVSFFCHQKYCIYICLKILNFKRHQNVLIGSHNCFSVPFFLEICFPVEKLDYNFKCIARWEGKGGVMITLIFSIHILWTRPHQQQKNGTKFAVVMWSQIFDGKSTASSSANFCWQPPPRYACGQDKEFKKNYF